MAAQDRTPPPAVTLPAGLVEMPQRYGFYDALRRIEAGHAHRPRLGRSLHPADDPIRLGQTPSLAFAPATLESLEPGKDGKPPRLAVAFLGLFGPNGPLPLHLTEYARDRARNAGDRTFSRFADLFHHRLLSLFYRAWADAEPAAHFDRPREDRFAVYVGALFGHGMASLRDRDAFPDHARYFFSGHLACQSRHAEGLRSILRRAFDVPVDLEEFAGEWLDIPGGLRLRLGRLSDNARLGAGATLGARVRDCQHKFRIVFGPLTMTQYQTLLPGGEALDRLTAIVCAYAGEQMDWEVELALGEDETPPLRLGDTARLGWTSWLGEQAARNERLRLDPRARTRGMRG